MKKYSDLVRFCLSALCVVLFVFIAAASDEGNSSGGGYTPTQVEEKTETDYSYDLSEEDREADDEEYKSDTDDEE